MDFPLPWQLLDSVCFLASPRPFRLPRAQPESILLTHWARMYSELAHSALKKYEERDLARSGLALV
jgi:hypothetical protein